MDEAEAWKEVGTVDADAAMIAAQAESPGLSWAFRSHPGVVRPENEDSVAAYVPHDLDERGPLFVVADGMGGHAAGEVASRLAVDSVLDRWRTASQAPLQALRHAARSANANVFGASLDHEQRGMGTTLTALAFAGREALVAHVGDSRCYLVRQGQCSQLTVDHSRVGEMLRMRLISPEQAATHPARSQLTRSLGAEPAVQVDLVRKDIAAGDRFVLCSDGLWDLVPRSGIAEVAERLSPVEAAEDLVRAAIDRGAPDNVTVVVVEITGDEPIGPSQRARPRLSIFGLRS